MKLILFLKKEQLENVTSLQSKGMSVRTRLIGSKEAIFLKEVKKINNNVNPSRPNLGQREKIKLNFYFHTSL